MASGPTKPVFETIVPNTLSGPVLFNSPHSGSVYPPAFLAASKLDPTTLRRSEDCHVDALFTDVVDLGAPLMRAHFPRAFVDVNREPYELDPEMFSEPLPLAANTRSLRVAGGLGTIPRVVAEAAEIYAAPLPLAEAQDRIERYYKPYHAHLGATLADIRRIFGAALLIDCHSMPSLGRDRRPIRPDIVLGDRFGMACMPEIVAFAKETLRGLGYSVCRNRPYAGGFITQRYGVPASGLHALQIEINRSLYMDEATLSRSENFATVRSTMREFAGSMITLANAIFTPQQDAAE